MGEVAEKRHSPFSTARGHPKARAPGLTGMLGRRQVVRQRLLMPPFAGSNPAAPASPCRSPDSIAQTIMAQRRCASELANPLAGVGQSSSFGTSIAAAASPGSGMLIRPPVTDAQIFVYPRSVQPVEHPDLLRSATPATSAVSVAVGLNTEISPGRSAENSVYLMAGRKLAIRLKKGFDRIQNPY